MPAANEFDYLFTRLASQIKNPPLETLPWDDLGEIVAAFNRSLEAVLGHGNLGIRVKRNGHYAEVFVNGSPIAAHVLSGDEEKMIREKSDGEADRCCAVLHEMWERGLPYSENLRTVVEATKIDVHLSEGQILERLKSYFYNLVMDSIAKGKISQTGQDAFWLLDVRGGDNQDRYPVMVHLVNESSLNRFYFSHGLLDREDMASLFSRLLRSGGYFHQLIAQTRLIAV